MKKVWIVIYMKGMNSTVSSECYEDIDDAIKFVKSRSNVERVGNSLEFRNLDDYREAYCIKELVVKGSK